MSISQADLAQLQDRINAADRAGFYILCHNLTGSNEALIQAQVSSYSGPLGQCAAYSSAAAKAVFLGRCPETTVEFCLAVAADLISMSQRAQTMEVSGVFPVRVVLCATADEIVAKRIDAGDKRLTRARWKSGADRRIVDVVAPL